MKNNQPGQSDNNYLDGQQQTDELPNITDNEFPNEDIKEANAAGLTQDQEGSLSNGRNSEENIDQSDLVDTAEHSGTSDEDIRGLNEESGEYNRDHEGGMIDDIGETEENEGKEDEENRDDVDKVKDINADSEVVDNRDVNETNRASYGDDGGAGSDSRFPKSV